MAGEDARGPSGGGGASSPEDAEAQAQQLMQYAEQVRHELAAVEEQRQMLSDVLSDYKRGRDALKAIQAGEGEDGDVLVPLGGGNYVSARLQLEGGKVLTSLGSGVHVQNDIAAALKRLESREESASKARDRMNAEAQKLQQEMTRLNQHLQMLSMGGAGGPESEG